MSTIPAPPDSDESPDEFPDEPAAPARLPPTTRPGPVRFQVAELSRSLEWYGEVLGMRTLESGPGWAKLGAHEAAPGSGAHLLQLVERPGAAPVPRGGHLGLFHAALLLPDRASLGRFVSHLRRLRIPAGSADHLVSEALYLNDPDGLGLEVYADRPPASWRRNAAGELAMATDPLALDDLVRAGGDTPWSGLPPGTRVGHLHLHVGDLPKAEAFYAAALGFDVQVRSYLGALFLSAGGYHHHLGVNTWARGAAMAAPDGARLLAWSLELPDVDAVDAALHRLEAGGYQVTRPASGRGQVRDPWATELELVGPAPSLSEVRR